MKFLALFSLIAPLASAAVIDIVDKPITYDGYRVVRIDSRGRAPAIEKMLKTLNIVQYNFDTKEYIEVAIAPESLTKFEKMRLKYEVLDEDLGASIVQEGGFFPDSAAARKISPSLDKLVPKVFPDMTWFDTYHTFAEHQQWLVDVQAAIPGNSELIEVGKSFQNRPLNGIHIWGSGGKDSKPAVLWHGTVHAREWISTMTVEYLTYGLITGYNSNNTQVHSILDNYDFYIIPVVNPDGFVYTQTTNRLWRKSRQTHPSSSCAGTDINRNWPFKWETPGGSSTNPCDETFRGLSPGNTPENTALSKHAASLPNGIKLYIDWHSFSQLILLPYGYDCNRQVANYDKQISLAKGVASAVLKTSKKTYTPGATCPDLYKAVGGSTDWMQDVGKAEISWCIELRPNGGGIGGFQLSPKEIKPTGEEMWSGMMYLLAAM
ncbi:hypothetical protein H072_4949 [Dactylellina haptotyla CBS 200.50]|uniref:Carboxypeptidase M14A n=1 Tax=Dactylellina haptotyla (strain CBS 200.50) TaxID=1284197 RepID=S8C0H9_DACHA|nr:hypothetical protein H072_4949 [Dactylellina haptotyla CBS 200.50]